LKIFKCESFNTDQEVYHLKTFLTKLNAKCPVETAGIGNFCSLLLFLMGKKKSCSLNIIGVRGFKKRAQVFEIIKYKMTWRSEILRHSTLLSGGVAVLYSKSCIPYSSNV